MISFDIFDTLITRKTYSPRGVFILMQKKMEKDQRYADISNDFAELRYESEQNAYKFYKRREIDIFDIYDILRERLGISRELIDDLICLELNTEKECALPIVENINILKEKKASGERTILASDMYLKADQIREILLSIDRVFEDMTIYVSCECGGRKANGKLYSYISSVEKVKYNEWTHYGDNVLSDNNIPNLYGINTKLVSKPVYTEIERSLASYFHVYMDYDVQIFLGLVRQSCMNHSKYSYKMGAVCGGAILFPYVQWILQRCQKEEIDRLLFMSRDGFLLKKIADVLISSTKMNVETDYVYVSKKVLRDYGEVGERARKYLERIIGDNDKYAFVDFQGTGKSLVELSKRMNKAIKCFYYLLEGDPHQGDAHLSCYTYIPISSGLIEIFCRAPHGSVYDYEVKGGDRVIPILEDTDDELWKQCGLFDYISGAIEFGKKYISYIEEFGMEINLNKIARYLIDYCENFPDDKTSQFIGDFPHDENNNNEGVGYAPLLTDEQIACVYGNRNDEPIENYYKGSNIEYSLKRSHRSFKEYVGATIKDITPKNEKKKRTKLIIYAAGKFGYEARYRLEKNDDCLIVGWVDINYQNNINCGVEPVGITKKRDFDYIIVCLNDKQQFIDVKDMLIEVGIEEYKIIWIKDYWEGFFV